MGAGAVGSHLAVRFALKGLDVCLIARPARAAQISATGLTLSSPEGEEGPVFPRVMVANDSPAGRFEIVILAVKAYSVEPAIRDIDRLLAPSGVVLAFQNGVGTDSILTVAFGVHRVIATTSTIPVDITINQVRQSGNKGGYAWACDAATQLQVRAASILHKTGFPVQRIESVAGLRWSKLLLNNVGSAQAAVLDLGVPQIVQDPRLFDIERQAFLETVSVMRMSQTSLVDLPDYRVRLAASIMRTPSAMARLILARRIVTARGTKVPGLAMDVAKGGPTEVAYLNGAVSREGRALGIRTPVNDVLTSLVEQKTVSRRRGTEFGVDAATLAARIVDARLA